ncbi:MAG TPA: SpaA isopeptide-forming pilin-related protein [Acidimicrobiales bacterium]|nr:SpaA isopeptide-forming pilin-related protein [Acidimicrobiales bacterium]
MSVTAGGPDCNGIIPTAGSANTDKTLTGGTLSSPGTANYQITFPADPNAVGGTFTVGDCALIGPAGATDLKNFTVLDEATFGFVDNGGTGAFNLDFSFNIPSALPAGTQICNVAKTTSSPTKAQASNRKAGPACFTIGGAAEFQKKDNAGNALTGGTFQIYNCVNSSVNPTAQPIIVTPTPTAPFPTPGSGAPPEGTVSGVSSISFNGAAGSTCWVKETAAPAGYNLNPNAVQITVPPSPGPTSVFTMTDTPAAFNTQLTTTQSADFQLGGGTSTMSDVAHLTISAGASTGTIGFKIYSDNACGTDVTPGAWGTQAADASGDYNSPSPAFAPATAGTYYFVAQYTSTDGKNTNKTTGCADEPVVVTPAAGSITIVKDANPADSTPFIFTPQEVTPTASTMGGPFTLEDPGTIAAPQSKTFTGLGAGTYTFTEGAFAGWTQGTPSCTITGTGTATGTGAGAASVTLGSPNDSATCTFTNTKQASITVDKTTAPAGSSQTFGYTWSGGAPFHLTGKAPNNSTLLSGLAPGAYSITEAATAGWDATNLVCSGTAAAPTYTGSTTVDLTLAAGENAVCTYTNTQQGSLKVVKDTVPTSATNFAMDVSDPAGNALAGSPATLAGNGGSATFTNLPANGTYTVAEQPVANWSLTNAVCTGNASAATATASGVKVPVGPGESVVCTLTNTQAATLIVNKTTVPAGSSQTFAFTSTVANTPSFNLSGVAGSNSQVLANLAPGAYTVTESPTAGWNLTGLTCTGTAARPVIAGAAATVTLAAGETGVCSYTNTQQTGGGGPPPPPPTPPAPTGSPTLQVAKTADAPVVAQGGNVGFTVTVSNTGTATASSVRLSDPLPVNPGLSWTIDPTETNGPSCTISATLLTCGPADLAAGASYHVHVVSVTTGSTCTSGSIVNTATAAASNASPAQATATTGVTCVLGVTLSPDPQITKTPDASTVAAGTPVGFTISLTNGGTAATLASIDDSLPTNAGLSWTIDRQPAVGPLCSIADNVLLCGPASLAVGSTWSVHITSPTTPSTCGAVNNTATVHAAGISPDRSSSATVKVTCVLGTVVTPAPGPTPTPAPKLPFTGANIGWSVLGGLISAAFGGLMILASRPRRNRRP